LSELTCSNGFRFCKAELGKDDIDNYLDSILPIDFVYCSTPNAESMKYWYGDKMKPSSYEDFFRVLCETCMAVDATEYHIEGGSNGRLIQEFFLSRFEYSMTRKIRYSAPRTSRGEGLVRRQIPYSLYSFSNKPIVDFRFDYSHEFLNEVLNTETVLACFDPCIGKGLLSRYAVKYGHSCYGIDMNGERLRAAVQFIENNV
jgi:hypothetical protein